MSVASGTPALVVCHGSFNPVHRSHVAIMVQARRQLEAAGFLVLAGVMAPTNREYLVWKGVEALSDERRFEALRLACRHAEGPEGWLRLDERGQEYGSGRRMISELLEPEVRREHPGAMVFNVLGSDVVARYQYQPRSPSVIVSRAGSAEAASILKASEASGDCWARTFFVEELPGDLSSTRVREALAEGDANAVLEMCPPEAARYLLAHRTSLYEVQGQAADEGYAPEMKARRDGADARWGSQKG